MSASHRGPATHQEPAPRRRIRRRLFGAFGAGLAAVLAVSSLSGISGSAGATPGAPSAAPAGGYWSPTSEQPRAQKDGHDSRVAPRAYEGYTLDRAVLADALDAAPLERRGGSPAVIEVPAPTGDLVEFAVVESPVMESRLAAAHPELRTFAGRAVADPTATIRLDLTPSGFHASVRGSSEQAAWYVDPAYNGDDSLYLSYRGSALPAPQKALVEPALDESQFEHADAAPDAGEAPDAEVSLRTYRLALVTDPSYATYFGTANVLAEKVTLMNRVNHVYGDDLTIKLVLINDTDKLNLDTNAKAIEANGPCGSAPCFSASNLSSCTGSALTRNRIVVGQLVGASNYDIGHLALGNPGGGVASAGVGGDGKARGCTGLPTPEGDFFAVDYVAHEMGHQFGGPHTFNGTQANCSGGNRSAASSVEPGSGSSVMAYAGICQQDNIQPHSDPYFSQRSVTSISTFVTNAPVAIDEVQTVSLYGFDGADSFTLTFDGETTAPITRGVNYDAAGIDAVIEAVTGAGTVEVAGWAGGTVDDTGFRVTFNGGGLADSDQPALVLNPSGDVTGFVGETARGGLTNPGGLTVTPTGNRAPTATAPEDKSIPVRTPFALTGSATDVDGDALVHTWEQNDRGGATGTALGNAVKLDGPLFRIFSQYAPVTPAGTLQIESPGENHASSNPTRVFPDLAQIAAGNTNQATTDCPAMPAPPASGSATNVPVPIIECYAESLPTDAYVGTALEPGPNNAPPSLNFRFTARDLAPEGGGYAFDDVRLTIDKTTGPFTVSSKNNPVSAAAVAGRTETISWSANTAALSPNVRITFSTDGGLTFPHVLVETTPNDGSTTVTWPDLATTKGRIRIEAVENYFFDLNNTDIEVVDLTPDPDPGPGPGPGAVPETTITSGPPDGTVLLGRSVTFGFSSSVVPAMYMCSLNGTPITCTGSSAELADLEGGTYTLLVAARAGEQTDPTPAKRTFTVPFDDDVLTQKGDWTDQKRTKSFDGDYLSSSDKGAKLKYRIRDAVGITLIVSTGKRFGPVKVMLGNTFLKTVPLRGKNRALRLKNVASFDSPRSGRLRIIVAKNKQVRIEGLAVTTG